MTPDEPPVHHAFEGTPAHGLAMVGNPFGIGSRCTPVCAG